MGFKTSAFTGEDIRDFDQVQIGESFELLADPNDDLNNPAEEGGLVGETFTKTSEYQCESAFHHEVYRFDSDYICRVI